VNRPGGYVETQTGVYRCHTGDCEPTGAVDVLKAKDFVFENCTFSNIGSVYAISVGGASQGVNITGCSFFDLSGGAVKLGNVGIRAGGPKRAVSKKTDDWDMQLRMEDNIIHGGTLEYSGAAAVFAGYVAQTSITHNTIYDTGYTGISLGWGWGTVVSFAHENYVTHNFVSFVMQKLNDGGCIYTLGPQPRSQVTDNYCTGVRAPVIGVFYHDNGSRYFVTQRNVAENAASPCVYLQGCCNMPALDIHVDHVWCKTTSGVRNGCAAERCTIDPSSLFTLSWQNPWSSYPEAQKVIFNSGARSGSRLLLKNMTTIVV